MTFTAVSDSRRARHRRDRRLVSDTAVTMQQVFRLFGYAGTGKSTITRHAIEALGLETGRTPGGCGRRAVRRLHRQGGAGDDPQGHAGLDHPQPDLPRLGGDARGDRRGSRRTARAPRRPVRDGARPSVPSRGRRSRKLELRLADIHEPRFVLNEQSLVRDADLIVLDEVSMVGAEMAADLLAFGKPILVLGDPGQLPPIKGEGAFTDAAPDVMLTEIHRQAGESAIIRLATMARQGEPIPYGAHDTHVWKMRRRDVAPSSCCTAAR